MDPSLEEKKARNRLSARKWYAKNRAARLETRKRRYAENRAKHAASGRLYRAAHRARINARIAAWRQARQSDPAARKNYRDSKRRAGAKHRAGVKHRRLRTYLGTSADGVARTRGRKNDLALSHMRDRYTLYLALKDAGLSHGQAVARLNARLGIR